MLRVGVGGPGAYLGGALGHALPLVDAEKSIYNMLKPLPPCRRSQNILHAPPPLPANPGCGTGGTQYINNCPPMVDGSYNIYLCRPTLNPEMRSMLQFFSQPHKT